MELEVESASVADRLSRVVPPPQSRRVGAVIMGLWAPIKREDYSRNSNLQLAQFMPVLLLPVGAGAAPDLDLEGGEPRPPELVVEPGGRFILL